MDTRIEEMTIQQAKDILNQAAELKKIFQIPSEEINKNSSSLSKNLIGKKCIIRTFSAGVHYGTVVAHKNQEVLLKNEKRIWRWEGANTLNEIALYGISKKSKVSEPISENLLLDAIEIIPCTDASISILDQLTWSNE